MSKYRNIPQATKDAVLHYINQVYDEAYELGYQRGRTQAENDVMKVQEIAEMLVREMTDIQSEIQAKATPEHDECEGCRYINCGSAERPCVRCCHSYIDRWEGAE